MILEDIHRLGGDIFRVLEEARHIGIVGHRDPDGDCMGSMLAWSGHFARGARPHVPFCVEGEIERWHFLPGSFRLERHAEVWRTHDFDVLIFVDTPDVRYAGLEEWLSEGKTPRPYIINIDHHHDNEQYGDVNLVIGDAPATAHIMYDLFVEHDVPIDRHIATCLLCGLLIDTHHFSNAATTGTTLATAADLVRRGANLPRLVRHLWQREQLSHLSVWGRMLTRLQRNARYDIVSTVVPHEDIAGINREVDGMANFLNLIGEGKCAVIVKEIEPGILKGSLRTTRNDVDVSSIARVLGGGGHQKAAGFSLPGHLVESEQGWRVQ